jgi:hydroxyacylglutathione hydrolase
LSHHHRLAVSAVPAAMRIHQFPALNDNYGYLLHDERTGATATVDTPDAEAVEAALQHTGWALTHVLNTHHHGDHTGGNLALKARHGCTVVGPAADADRIPGIDVLAEDGSTHQLGSVSFLVLHVPGHTRGHCAYYFPTENAAFVGDTLFSLGCGRLFEGTPAEMWASLQSLCALPDDTLMYCAHEYTEANGRFALSLEPGNAALVARMEEVRAARAAGKATVPTTLATEKATNPFLRAHSQELRQALGFGADARDVDVFAAARKKKDTF